MSVFLVGGGVSSRLGHAFDLFAEEVGGLRGPEAPQVMVVLSGPEEVSGGYLPDFEDLLS